VKKPSKILNYCILFCYIKSFE